MVEFSKLRDKYNNFKIPRVKVMVGGKDVAKDKGSYAISNIEVELTSGYEASVAQFVLYDVYNPLTHTFKSDDIKKYITLGSPVEISMGYEDEVTPVFRGFISQVVYVFRRGEVPGVEVHAMDIKGIMMANDYAKQIKASSYSEAVNSIFKQSFYQKLKGSSSVFQKLSITDTPDKKPSPGGDKKEVTDRSIEMVNESDYEFVVRAAKRYNYEFFQVIDTIFFRKAKSDTKELMTIGPEQGMMAFEIGYDVTGLAGKIEVRNVDPSKGKMVNYKTKMDSTISHTGKAKQLVAKQTKVFIDPTAATQQEAQYRAGFLQEEMSYRFGTMEADMLGIPELIPGKFVLVNGLGKNVSNKFYVTSVRHSMSGDSFYQTHITGKASGLYSPVSTGIKL
ncbi:MAG: hypothetical protein K6A92_06095 [Lachnospiraceae bacterium]|nr:hypothetical protein [Lachnospiraceae bacterium]